MVDFPALTCYLGSASLEGISLVPTLLFIVGVYSFYALFIFWTRSRRRRLPGPPRGSASRLARASVAVLLIGILGIAVRVFSPDPDKDKTVYLSGIIGPAGVGLLMSRGEPLPEKPPVADKGPGSHPVYALLHPETPPTLMPEKLAPSAQPPRKFKVKRPAAQTAQKVREGGKTVKEKPAAPAKAKKTKTKKAATPHVQQAYSALRH